MGVSTHSSDQIAEAAKAPVSYIAVGPVFGTATKDTGYDAVGLDLVRHAAATAIDVVAIGGVTLDRVPQLIAAGATSVAVITDLLAGGDPAARTRAFRGRRGGRKGRAIMPRLLPLHACRTGLEGEWIRIC